MKIKINKLEKNIDVLIATMKDVKQDIVYTLTFIGQMDDGEASKLNVFKNLKVIRFYIDEEGPIDIPPLAVNDLKYKYKTIYEYKLVDVVDEDGNKVKIVEIDEDDSEKLNALYGAVILRIARFLKDLKEENEKEESTDK